MFNFWMHVLLAVCGASFGILSSAGVFTVLASVGLVPRFAGKMHVAGHIFALEEAVIFGTVAGGCASVFYKSLGEGILPSWPGTVFLIVFGFFAGIFVGCLALAIAEMLNSIPIFSRRTGFRHGLGIALLFAALGKMAGSIFYFLFIQ